MIEKGRLIFITNDDGFKSNGIKYLKKITKLNNKNNWVFAPKYNQSAKGHSITINKNIIFSKLKNKEYFVNGTPTDCVIIGLNELKLKGKTCNLIIAGVNEGVNLGYDLLYSGTVAAAREGSLNGIQSIAMSIEKGKKKINWRGFEYFAPKIIKVIIDSKVSNKYFFNINFPSENKDKIKGVKVVKLGQRKPGSVIIKDKGIYKIPSERKILKNSKPDEDEYEFKKGFITVTIHNYNNLIINENIFLKIKYIIEKNFE